MPNSIPAFQIQNFLSRHTAQVPIFSLPNTSPHDQQCPICHSFYIDPPSSHYVHPDFPLGAHIAEYAVRIKNVGGCEHIFGRRCLEKHLKAGLPWSHTCPMCRREWLPPPNAGRRDILREIDGALQGLERVEELVRDDGARMAVEGVERGLRRAREGLEGNRWI
ncbi:hypothetical protein DE146DRAFT_651264 [Phaeosphaeria sp. MPI-PUGE-AT-0046c]|nr:hypothetical protein DE146DRAFT_651264 [Phaeosphaeria sp. MPI-PUGE-AT-0046c]